MAQYSTDQRKTLRMFFMENNHETFSAKQIEEKLKNSNISISAIYRNLALMEKDGELCRIAGQNSRETLYQFNHTESCSGALHLVCDKCSITKHLNKYVSELISNMALDNFGFKVNNQKTIIYGLCENCSQIQNK